MIKTVDLTRMKNLPTVIVGHFSSKDNQFGLQMSLKTLLVSAHSDFLIQVNIACKIYLTLLSKLMLMTDLQKLHG